MPKPVDSVNTRAVVLEILIDVNENKKYSHNVINKAFNKYKNLNKQDRAFISRLVHGTLERQLSIDYIISLYSKVKVSKIKNVILQILRLSIYQIMYMDKIPDSAACNEALKLVEKRGMVGLKPYTNGLLRTVVKNKENISYPDMSTKYSMPEWIVKLFSESYSKAEVEEILESFLEDKKLCVRVNLSKTDPDSITKALELRGISVEASPLFEDILYLSDFDSISEIEEISSGKLCIQDFSSAMVARLAGIKMHDTVIDVCAAPGGKSLHAADILKGSGKVLAFDISEAKLKLIEENKKRCAFENIHIGLADASVLKPELVDSADVVIADLPCSGLGIIGKKPDIKYNTSYDAIIALSKIQRQILDNVSQYVKKGGRLVFSTCTVTDIENLQNRDYFLKKHKDFKPLNLSAKLSTMDCDTKEKGYVQLLPNRHGSDGFFISAYERDLE